MDYVEQYEQDAGDESGQQFGQIEQDVGDEFGGEQPAGLSQWGSTTTYSLKNVSTANYLAAHPDGQLVAEDDTTGHHDVPWSIYSTNDGRVALKSCHSKYLDTDGSGLPTNNGEDPNQSTWELVEQGQGGVYGLRSPDGQYLQAVPPNGDEQQVFLSNQCGEAESWQIEPMSNLVGDIDSLEGRFF